MPSLLPRENYLPAISLGLFGRHLFGQILPKPYPNIFLVDGYNGNCLAAIPEWTLESKSHEQLHPTWIRVVAWL